MVKFDPSVLRYMSKDEFRVLTAVEMGMKNHEIVPTELICRIAGLKKGGASKMITLLHKNKLIFHDAKKYDGYRLTYLGYDFLALKAFSARGKIKAVGRQIGVGKESDIFVVQLTDGKEAVLKIHRLGRVSFRAVKNKRDYLLHRKSASWLYMSRLAALREYAYMNALHKHGFPTPTPIDVNRHCIVMSKVNSIPFSQVRSLGDPGLVYTRMMNLIVRLAEHGLIHCDFNEFNTMIHETTHKITMIDFPQMVSTKHKDAEEYFNRDVECVRVYFGRRFKFHAEKWPKFFTDVKTEVSLDTELEASGYKNHEAEYQAYRSVILRSEEKEIKEEETGKEVMAEEKEELPEEGKELLAKKEVSSASKTPMDAKKSTNLKNSENFGKVEEGGDEKVIETSEDPLEEKGGSQVATRDEKNTNQDEDEVEDEDEDGASTRAVADTKNEDEKKKRRPGRRKKRITRESIRAKVKKGLKGRAGGRTRNVQKNRKKQALKERIKEWT
ncbi:hypothetical protein AAMO2058_001113900 [Amorphochlora amoebiformis]